MSIEAKYFFQIKTDANRYRTVSNPPRTVNRTEACVPRYTVKRYIVSPLKNRQLCSANVKIVFWYECSCFICM